MVPVKEGNIPLQSSWLYLHYRLQKILFEAQLKQWNGCINRRSGFCTQQKRYNRKYQFALQQSSHVEAPSIK